MLEDDPELERDINNLCRTAQFRRLKRYVVGEDSQGGDPKPLAKTIASELMEKLLDFDAKG